MKWIRHYLVWSGVKFYFVQEYCICSLFSDVLHWLTALLIWTDSSTRWFYWLLTIIHVSSNPFFLFTIFNAMFHYLQLRKLCEMYNAKETMNIVQFWHNMSFWQIKPFSIWVMLVSSHHSIEQKSIIMSYILSSVLPVILFNLLMLITVLEMQNKAASTWHEFLLVAFLRWYPSLTWQCYLCKAFSNFLNVSLYV